MRRDYDEKLEKDTSNLFRIFNVICDVWKFGQSGKRTK